MAFYTGQTIKLTIDDVEIIEAQEYVEICMEWKRHMHSKNVEKSSKVG